MATQKRPADREALLDELRRLKAERGTLPSMDDVAEMSQFPMTAYVEEFGSYIDAIQAAGMETEIFTRGAAASNEQLLDDLREFADELDHRPSQSEMDEHGPHTAQRYAGRFGSWNEAIEAAGMDPWEPQSIPEADLLDAIDELANEVGRVPTTQDMESRGPYSAVTYHNRFGSWTDALEAAGYDSAEYRTISNAEVINAIHQLGQELGRPPTMREMDDQGAVSSVLAWDRFGSWDNALRTAGYDPDSRRFVYDEADIVDALQAVVDDLGYIPTTEEFDTHDAAPMKAVTVRARFGSWRDALRAAGVSGSQD